MELKTEGIVLYVVPYGEEHEIAGVLGPSGLLSFMRKWKRRRAPLSPLTRCEFVCRQGRGEMGTIKEMSILDPYLSLRERLEVIQAAMECVAAVRKILLPGEHAEKIYLLFKSFLERMGEAADPLTFLSAFYLKLLIHEGLLELEKLSLEMALLASERSFSALKALKLPPEVHDSIKKLFLNSVL